MKVSRQLINNSPLTAIIDTETTGLNSEHDFAWHLGCVLVREWQDNLIISLVGEKLFDDKQSSVDYFHQVLTSYKVQTVVAYNAKFDLSMLKFRNSYNITTLCLMNIYTDICKLPSRYYHKYKAPKLSEAIAYIQQQYQTETQYILEMTNHNQSNFHDALFDAVQSTRLYACYTRKKMVLPADMIISTEYPQKKKQYMRQYMPLEMQIRLNHQLRLSSEDQQQTIQQVVKL